MRFRFARPEAFYAGPLPPEELPGVRKVSFAMPFRGGEIWFEHLDGMYQFTDLVLAKLARDEKSFLRPSGPADIGFVLNETAVTPEVTGRIADVLVRSEKRFLRVGFIGAQPKTKKSLTRLLKQTAPFAFAFFDDLKEAKEWLVSEGV